MVSGEKILDGKVQTQPSVEVFSLGTDFCIVPDLPEARYGHTANAVDGKVIVCGGYPQFNCIFLTSEGWHALGTSTIKVRDHHTSMAVAGGVLLMGGRYSPETTEIVPVDGGPSRESFPLKPGRKHACAVALNSTTVFLLGGAATYSLVTRHHVDTWANETFPELNQGRMNHGCGLAQEHYLVVAGGWANNGTYLDDCEMYDLDKGREGAWQKVDSLASPREGLKGAPLNGELYMTGGRYYSTKTGLTHFNDILVFQPSNGTYGTWSSVGVPLKHGRFYHGITQVANEDICNLNQ